MPSKGTRLALLNQNYRTAGGTIDALLIEGSTGYQPNSAALTNLSTLTTVGLLTMTSTGQAITSRTLTAGSTRVTITAGNGSTANPSVDVNAFPSTFLSDTLVIVRNNSTSGSTFAGALSVPDDVYSSTGWDGSLEVPTKNAIRDKFESIGASTGTYTDEQAQDAVGTILGDTATIDFTYTDATPEIKADLKLALLPAGRLTLVSATPVMTSDQTAKTTVYYAEYLGNTVPIYDGTNTKLYTFSNLSAILDTTNHKLENLYDMFAYLDTTAKIGFGPAWVNTATVTMTIASPAVISWTAHGLPEGHPVIFTTSGALPTGITAGTTYYVTRSPNTNDFMVSTTIANAANGTGVNTSGTQSGVHTGTNHTTARGTGAGTTELELKNGLLTNKNSITLYNNAVSSGSISANQATFLGTLYCTANGQTGMAFAAAAASGGSNGFLALSNAHNRVRVMGLVRDSTANWTYATAAWQPANAAVSAGVGNRLTVVDCLARATVDAYYGTYTSGNGVIAVNRNNTNGTPLAVAQGGSGGAQTSVGITFTPLLGLSYFQMMQYAASGTATFYGSYIGSQMGQMQVGLEM